MITLPDPIVYYRIVWEIVRHIPAGKVSTYGHIATMIPAPAGVEAADYEKLAPRWVGDAMNAVSRVDDPEIPWHRVINSKGEISLPPDSVSAALQRARLRHEGTMADDAEIVDLNQYLWEPDRNWLWEHGLRPPKSLKKQQSHTGQMRLF
ncbi:MAG: MGMT family protein [Chloroflexi bacterium]|uniref:MGMT family protein n=1 Tax=Candidatus Flexifilum breve TaxID=3140694 RepID=UPI00313505F0|nr:MGMT family protein [Chloroflexota bacterium]MBK9748372.1 MGMT family protein [Chloroflexota bacterium]